MQSMCIANITGSSAIQFHEMIKWPIYVDLFGGYLKKIPSVKF